MQRRYQIDQQRAVQQFRQMAREEISKTAGTVAFISVLSILVILLAVVALIIVNALKDSPWGAFTIGMTIPIALLMGVYLRYLRPGRVLEASVLGFLLVVAAIFGGQSTVRTWPLIRLVHFAMPLKTSIKAVLLSGSSCRLPLGRLSCLSSWRAGKQKARTSSPPR